MNDFMFYLRMGWDHIVSKDALDHQLFILVLIAVYTIQDFKKSTDSGYRIYYRALSYTGAKCFRYS